MTSTDNEGQTSPLISSPVTERSSLLRQPSFKTAYGASTFRSDLEYGGSENGSLLSRSEDEEASIDSNATCTPTEVDGLQAHDPLSSKAILWIVLPMLLGLSNSCSPWP